MKEIKIVFMGTPIFSVPVLEGLIKEYNVVGVVSQPDKKVGRKQQLQETPVKEVAKKHHIEVLQPIRIKEDYQDILDLNPDIIVTCAYGQIIPKEILDFPRLGCINVHASLLPKLRGGAPIHKSIIEGYKKTGITIMYMDQKMDSGDIITQKETTILDSDNLETVSDRLSIMGKELLLETLPSIIEGTNNRIKQNIDEVTFAYNITREEEQINFTKSTREIFNQIRGLSPKPGAYAVLEENQIKIFESMIGNHKYSEKQAGEIVEIYKEGIGVATLDGEIIITSLQWPGKKRVSARDYLNGINKDSLIGKQFK